MRKLEKKRVYIVGICGVTTAPLAKMFKGMGWEVAGSDQGSYPPMSEYLKKNDISFKTPYHPANIVKKPDLVVIGGNALVGAPKNPEYLRVKKWGCEIVSYPEVLKRYIIKENSIVIAGTYGKTTITALVALILEKAGCNPSFMIGGLALNFPDGVRRTDSAYSVVEGDEHPTLNFSPEPKFRHYKPKYALITSAQWDHLNVFKTEKSFVDVFVDFVKLIPESGTLFVCADGKNTRKLIKTAKCRVITYALKTNVSWQAKNISYGDEFVTFEVEPLGLVLRSNLWGEHNVQNVLGAVALSSYLGIKPNIIKQGVESFKGVKRRLQIRDIVKEVTIIDDLAHSPVKIKETLKALRTKYKNNKIIAVFDPHASSFQDRRSLVWYKGIFAPANQVLVAKAPLFKETPPDQRVLGSEIVRAISKTQANVRYFPKDENLIDFIIEYVSAGDIVVFMSSGGFRGIIENTIAALKQL